MKRLLFLLALLTSAPIYAANDVTPVYPDVQLLKNVTSTTTGAPQKTNTVPYRIVAYMTGVGAVSATVDIYCKSANLSWSSGTQQGSSISLSGTTKDDDTGITVTAACPYMYAVVTAISGTSATVDVVAVPVNGLAGSSSSSPAYVVPLVDGTAVSAANPLPVDLATTISGEDQTNDLLKTSGGTVRSTTVATGITTNTTSALVALPVGAKTFVGKITGCSSGCTQTQAIYGDQDDDSGTDSDGVLLCTISLSASGDDTDACPAVTANFPYYYVVTTGTAGTSNSGAVYANY